MVRYRSAQYKSLDIICKLFLLCYCPWDLATHLEYPRTLAAVGLENKNGIHYWYRQVRH